MFSTGLSCHTYGQGARDASGCSFVSVIEAVQSRKSDDRTVACRLGPVIGRLFPEAEVGSVFLVIADVLRQQAFQMALVQGDDMVQQIAPATLHPAFGCAVLPGTFKPWQHAG